MPSARATPAEIEGATDTGSSGQRWVKGSRPATDTAHGDPLDGAKDDRTRSVRTPQQLFREGEARWE
jgi:hypothetical protein